MIYVLIIRCGRIRRGRQSGQFVVEMLLLLGVERRIQLQLAASVSTVLLLLLQYRGRLGATIIIIIIIVVVRIVVIR